MDEDVRAVFEVERRARQCVAAELHDVPIQVLSAAQWQLEALAAELPDDQRSRLAAAAASIRQAQRQLRMLMGRLHSAALVDEGLAVALQDLFDELAEDLDGSATVQLDVSRLHDPPLGSAAVVLRVVDAAIAAARAGIEAGTVTAIRATLTDDEEGAGVQISFSTDGPLTGDDLVEQLALAAGGRWWVSADGTEHRVECRLPRW